MNQLIKYIGLVTGIYVSVCILLGIALNFLTPYFGDCIMAMVIICGVGISVAFLFALIAICGEY